MSSMDLAYTSRKIPYFATNVNDKKMSVRHSLGDFQH